MSMNGNDVPMGGGKKQALMDVGSYPARVLGIIDLGLQPQEYQGEEKAPAREIMLDYEFSDEFILDDDGEEDKTKPRVLSERMALRNLKVEKAKSTLRYLAIDPANNHKGDFVKLVSDPCMVTVITKPGSGVNKGKEFNRVGGVSSVRAKDVDKMPPLVNKPRVFLLDSPDKDVFDSFPEFIRNIITSNLEYKGSKLEALLSGKDVPEEGGTEPGDKDDWRE